MMKNSKGWHVFVFIFLAIGGLNYLFMLGGYGLDSILSGSLLQIVYILFGLAALYSIWAHKGCSMCKGGKGDMKEHHDMSM